jgi:hypothetical protein
VGQGRAGEDQGGPANHPSAEGNRVKTVAFTVRGTMAQGIRWKQAADADGHLAVGNWLAEAADAYLKARARAGRPVPLAWRRGHFRVLLADGSEVTVRGMVSPPFGTFRGTADGPDGNKCRTLVHVPSRQVVATLRSARACKALASEIAPLWLRDRELAAGVVERHLRESV